MVIASELKPGMFLRIEGEIYKVLEAESKAGSAKLGGVVKTKLCNVTSGRMSGRARLGRVGLATTVPEESN